MKYSLDLLKKANETISKRRQNAMDNFEENKKIAYTAIPELIDIDSVLSSSGLIISRRILGNKEEAKKAIEDVRKSNQELIHKKQTLLKKNGFDENFLKVAYTCNKCNDTGYVDAMPCPCLIEIIEKLEKENDKTICPEIDDPFNTFKLEYYPDKIGTIPCKEIMTSIFENCKDYAEEFSHTSPSLLLFGGTGIGKTHLSLAIAKKVQQKGFDVIYLSAPDLFTSLESERFNQKVTAESMQRILSCDLLVIDDLGTEFSTTFTTSALYNIVNTRLLSESPTIITANLSPSELTERYSDRIASRLLGCYEHLRFIGNDIRILKKKGL